MLAALLPIAACSTADGSPPTGTRSKAADGAAGSVQRSDAEADDRGTRQPPLVPVYRVELRVHVGRSTLPPELLSPVLAEINFIWRSQAAICFEMHTVFDDLPLPSGFDLWLVPVITELPDTNGIIYADHAIYSRDGPLLEPAEIPVVHPAARTAAHELGHGLGLGHYNGQPDSSESLMASRRMGYLLHDFEITRAREQAAIKGLAGTLPLDCRPPRIE